MSRYGSPSDMDYTDEPWHRPMPCQTRGCDNTTECASLVYCYECRVTELEKYAEANRQHRAEMDRAAARVGRSA